MDRALGASRSSKARGSHVRFGEGKGGTSKNDAEGISRNKENSENYSSSKRKSTATAGDTKFAASKHCRFELVPGHQNTTTKEPLPRPPEMRLVTSLASKGRTLTESLREMNMGPSRRETALQKLSTRDVLMVPDLFETSSGFVIPEDPFSNNTDHTKTIYQRLVEEIHHAGRGEQRGRGGKGKGKGGDPRPEGDDANGLFKAWHKTTSASAGDGLRDPNARDGNGHLIVNDKDDRWQQAQRRGEAPMYTAVLKRIEEFFAMKIEGKRYNHYRDMTNWKPFHHDAAGLDKTKGKGGRKGKGKGGKGGRPPMCEVQNMTVGVSFGETRQAAFEWAGERVKDRSSFPQDLMPPPSNPGRHANVVLSLTLPDSSCYTFGRDVNLLWKHGILAERAPSGKLGGEIQIEEGRISIIAWGWVDQYDDLDAYLNGSGSGRAMERDSARDAGRARSGSSSDGRPEGRNRDGRGHGRGHGHGHGRDHKHRNRSRSREQEHRRY